VKRLVDIGVITALLVLHIVRCIPALAQAGNTIYGKDVQVIQFEDVAYPSVAQTGRMEGVVVVRVKLDTEGKVVAAETIYGDEVFVHTSIENAKQWQFRPNSQSAAIIVYRFRIEGVCHPGLRLSLTSFHPPNYVSVVGCAPVPEPR
jgi:TonB family protein